MGLGATCFLLLAELAGYALWGVQATLFAIAIVSLLGLGGHWTYFVALLSRCYSASHLTVLFGSWGERDHTLSFAEPIAAQQNVSPFYGYIF